MCWPYLQADVVGFHLHDVVALQGLDGVAPQPLSGVVAELCEVVGANKQACCCLRVKANQQTDRPTAGDHEASKKTQSEGCAGQDCIQQSSLKTLKEPAQCALMTPTPKPKTIMRADGARRNSVC